MGRNHFAKTFHSPYFQSDYYKKETPGGILEDKIERWLKKMIAPIKKLTPKKPSEGN